MSYPDMAHVCTMVEITMHAEGAEFRKYVCPYCYATKTEPLGERQGGSMAKFHVGDKVRDRYTGAEGVVTRLTDAGILVEWLDADNRVASFLFEDHRLTLLETAAVRDRDEEMPMREPRELRVTEPAPLDGGELAQEDREQPDATPVSVDPETLEVTAEGLDEEELLVEETIDAAADAEPEEDPEDARSE